MPQNAAEEVDAQIRAIALEINGKLDQVDEVISRLREITGRAKSAGPVQDGNGVTVL